MGILSFSWLSNDRALLISLIKSSTRSDGLRVVVVVVVGVVVVVDVVVVVVVVVTDAQFAL